MTNHTGQAVQTPPLSLAQLDGSNGFVIPGIADGDFLGASVSGAGDVNGDGFDDIVVGAPGGGGTFSDIGHSYVVFGRPGGFDAIFDAATLDGSNGFRIEGVNSFGNAGFFLSGGGDINGDGLSDVIVGTRSQQSYVVFGSAEPFAAIVDLATLDGTNGFRTGPFESRSISVGGAGDFDGDGLADVLIGAFGSATSVGESFLVYGRTGGFAASLDPALLDGVEGFRMTGDAGDGSGFSVGGAGDFNGDDLADIIIGAPENPVETAEAYVVFGTDQLIAAGLELAALAGGGGVSIESVDPNEHAGTSVSGAGDLNGDGFADIVIGAPNRAGTVVNPGGAYVVFGSDLFLPASIELDTLNGGNGFRVDGSTESNSAGSSVGAAGDVNGDGLDDIIIGRSESTTEEGVHVVYGSDAVFPAVVDLGLLDGVNGFQIQALDKSELTGFSVDGAGDLNGDGFDDFVIGAPFASPDDLIVDGELIFAGKSYVVFGGDFTGAVDRLGGQADDVLIGTPGGDTIVGGAGNDILDGKGGPDVLRAGAGDDTLVLRDPGFLRLDGGGGADRLVIDGFDLDLTLIRDMLIADIEAIDLGDGRANQLTLGLSDLRNLSGTSNTVIVTGDAGDRVSIDLRGTGFVSTDIGDGFTEYTDGILALQIQDLLDGSGILM